MWSIFQGQRRIFVRPEGLTLGTSDCGMPHYQPNLVPRLSRLQGGQRRENLGTRLLSTNPCVFYLCQSLWRHDRRLPVSERRGSVLRTSFPASLLFASLAVEETRRFAQWRGRQKRESQKTSSTTRVKIGNFSAKACSISSSRTIFRCPGQFSIA